MNFLKHYRNIGDQTISKENHLLLKEHGLDDWFTYSEECFTDGDFTTWTRDNNLYGLENWNNLTYTSQHGDKLKIPEGIIKFKDWIEKEQSTKTFNITTVASTFKFNPALNGGTIKTVGGGKYLGFDCDYMIPFCSFKDIHTRVIRAGDVTIVQTYDVWCIGVVYCDEASRHYGKVGFFVVNNRIDYNNIKLKEWWGFLKWFQPSFDYHIDTLDSRFMTFIDKIRKFFKKVKESVLDLFSSHKSTEEELKENKA
nr:MAG TPA: hypothetical protein [Caudoviricetes sp.]